MKSMRRVLIVTVSLMMIIILSSTANASSKKESSLKAYNDLLTQKILWYPGKYVNVRMFALIYLDKDSTPELCVEGEATYAEGIYKIFTYYKGKVKELELPDMSIASWFNRTNDMCSVYYKKTGFFARDWAKQGVARLSYDYYPGRGKKVVRICSKAWAVADEKQASYYAGYSLTSKEQYNRLIKTNSKGKKATKVKWLENTSANRKKYLK